MNQFPGMVLVLLAVIIIPFSGLAQEQEAINEMNGYVHINIEYTSMFPGFIQVKDEICAGPRSFDCEKNKIRLESDECRKEPKLKECREARILSESSSCMEGLIFEGRVARGEKIKAFICASYAGYGNISIRDLKNGQIWTNYSLTSNNATLRYP